MKPAAPVTSQRRGARRMASGKASAGSWAIEWVKSVPTVRGAWADYAEPRTLASSALVERSCSNGIATVRAPQVRASCASGISAMS